jgi:integrase
MATYNVTNERIKRKYLIYLKEAMRYSEASVDAVAKALSRFGADTKYRDFKAFHVQQAVAFKKRLADKTNPRTGKKLSKATLNATCAHLKRFFHWLAGQPTYKSRLQYADADYFNLSENDVRVATAKREKVGPTLDQVKHVISLMPTTTVIQRRDRALIAFTLLTGARDSAIASMKLKHVDLEAGCVEQDAREVLTKNSKTFTTYFFRVGDEIREVVTDWVEFLRADMLWGNDDPLFSATEVGLGESSQFQAMGLKRAHWSNASRIRTIFREAFAAADLPYFNPHSFRNTLVRLGQSACQTPEEFKAWSQNLGHEKVLTTLMSYGYVDSSRQGEIIRGLAGQQQPAVRPDVSELAKALVREMRVR